MSRYLGVVVGEASGDSLAADLCQRLSDKWPDLQIEGILGERTLSVGGRSIYPMDRLSVMGLWEALQRLPELLGIRSELAQYFCANPPDVFVGVDAPDFNLILEKKLRKQGIRTVQYVSPSIWAWRRGRIKLIQEAVDAVLCLLPFEVDIYPEFGIPAYLVGHPLAKSIPIGASDPRRQQLASDFRRKFNIGPDALLIALMPGSRSSELHYSLPLLLNTMQVLRRDYPDAVFVIAAANSQRAAEIRSAVDRFSTQIEPPLMVDHHQVRSLLCAAHLAVASMGTITLEIMLSYTPMVAFYRGHWMNALYVKWKSYIQNYSLPNLLAGHALVPELMHSNVTVERLSAEARRLIESDNSSLLDTFSELHQKACGDPAGPSAAEVVAEVAGWKSV
ncbi:MAG: lipid-A-disaccharide synthase [Gammaproteobacteria bacterium]